MAAFCSPHYFKAGPEPVAIKGIFRFLDDLHDDVALQNALQESLKQQTPPKPTFTPRFDISETETAYHLHGELPGLSKSNIDIDFTDAQTITIKGVVDRIVSPYPQQTTVESNEVDSTSEQRPASPHQATVEDDFEDLAAETNSTTTTTSSTNEKPNTPPAEKTPEAKTPEPQAKYWMSERKFGHFARSFKFRKTVDVAEVSASLESGVLSVVVPKKNESRKILVH